MSNKTAMPARVAVEAAYAFTDAELTAWIAKSGWGKPILYPNDSYLNAAIAKVIAAFPA